MERLRKRFRTYGIWHGTLDFISSKLKRIKSSAIALRLRIIGVHVGRSVFFHGMPLIKGVPGRIRIEQKCELEKGVVLWTHVNSGRIRIGTGSYLGINTIINSYDSITIGDRTMIAAMCYLVDHDHGMATGMPMQDQPLSHSPIVVADDCWLGAGVKVVKGITLRKGTVIGAGAVVTQDSQCGGIMVGVPARTIGVREPKKVEDRPANGSFLPGN